ncbi:TraU family protein [Arcobacter lacus]|uniref:TraU family protein n=1 Tax=Arcobacter lacus TaxID=1912876 RepID=UPI0021BA4F10|nr:TraU family protein [Arcobacter lacus]MCT7910363.1 TraU family protein [Arcobacter lacus]
MLKKIIINLLIFSNIYMLAENIPSSLNASKACKSAIGNNSLMTVMTNTITSIYNILPISIAGVNVTPSNGAEDINTTGGYCGCWRPWYTPGIVIGFWEPVAIIDVSNIPNCLPSLGMHLDIDIVAGSSFQEINKDNTQNKESYQVTYLKYPVFSMIGLFKDMVCTGDSDMDISYISTIDPLWQNDMWSIFIHPDAFLFANTIAQFACIIDAVASQIGFPLDPLYWCFGSWNQTFPLTKATSGVSSPEAAMSSASKLLHKMHRQSMLNGTIDYPGLCSQYPMPIMSKRQYNLFPVYPIMSHPYRIPIGRSGFVWNPGMEVPVVNSHQWSIAVYRKRNCCSS